MTDRVPARVEEIRRGRWLFAYEIAWFPDLLSDPDAALSGQPIREAFGRQIAFLRALAGGAPEGTSLQLRFISHPDAEALRCVIIGGAPLEEAAARLSAIVLTAMPPEVPLQRLSAPSVREVLDELRVDTITSADVAELRRSVEVADPTLGSSSASADPVVLPWTWSAQAMLSSLGLLRRQPSVTHLIVHVAPTPFPAEVAGHLQDEVDRLRQEVLDGQDLPMLKTVMNHYWRWLRVLPAACLHVRVMVASRAGLVPGLAESLSTDLTRAFEAGADLATGTAEVVIPVGGRELDACAALLDDLNSQPWRVPAEPALAGLLHLFDPLEANVAFRIPVTPSGGLPGVASRRPSALDGGVAGREVVGPTVQLGVNHDGRPFVISTGDVNQHVLVSGQPGFGKSSTVRLLLHGLWTQHRVPFLVLDPAKDDYGAALIELAGGDPAAKRIQVDPEVVCFNPLAVPAGTPRVAHAGRIVAALDSIWGLSAVNPLALVILQRGLKRAYDAAGTANPTLADLYRSVAHVIRKSSFAPEAKSNIEGTLLGRLEVLLTTTVGRALSGGPRAGIDWEAITRAPAVIELGGLPGPPERALVFALLMGSFVGYREANPLAGGLGHVTVLEEAHRFLRAGSTAQAGIDVFVDAIAELRGAGEGFVVVDQNPALLHPGVLRLTGSKIAHRLVDVDERAAVAGAMVLDARQSDELARLAPRRAVAYLASADTAALVDVGQSPEPEAGVATSVAERWLTDGQPLEFPFACIGCPAPCEGARARAAAPKLLSDMRAGALDAARLDEAAASVARTPAEQYCVAATAAAIHLRGNELQRSAWIEQLGRAYRARQRRSASAPASQLPAQPA